MNAPEHRRRNRLLGIGLSLLFVVLFIVATRIMVTGSKVPPAVEGTMVSVRSPVLWFIGSLLVILAVVEIVLQIEKRGESIISNLVAPLLGTIGLLLIVGAIFGVVFSILKNREVVFSDLGSSIILGTIGLLLMIGAVIRIAKDRLSE